MDPRTRTVYEKFPEAVKAAYDFTNAKYTGALSPITGIRCPRHGEFQQYSAQLRKGGAGCPACGAEARAASLRLPPEEFVARCMETHSGKYDYSVTCYTSMKARVQVRCPLHGVFSISPIKHLYGGQGCPACGALSRGHRKDVATSSIKSAATKVAAFARSFVHSAVAVHGDTYDYSQVQYVGAKAPVTIICNTHGAFSQVAWEHLNAGAGCPKCSHHLSRGEDAVFRFLSNLTPAEQRNRTLLKPKELDIYLPEIKLAVEYCGEFWHSHGDAEDERKNKLKHHQKYLDCKAQGIRLITLYETEWKEHNYAVRRLLRNAVGKSRGKLMARKCELRKATTQEARQFYDRYHPQGGAGHGEHYALFWQGKMVACMRFVLGANDRGAGAANRVWTLGRYATRVTVAGAASRLFKAFVQEYNPPVVKSFSDNRFFEGGMYAQLGFALEADVEPDYQVWHPKLGTKPKPHYQRRAIPRRIAEIGANEVFDPETDPRTEAQITYALGARRLYDCGKKRWVWTPTP